MSGSPNVGTGATVSCSGLNLGAVRHLYYGMRVDRTTIGDALDNSGPSSSEIFRYSSRTTNELRYTGLTQVYNSIVGGGGYQAVQTELRLAFPAGGTFIVDPVIHALNSTANGDVEVLREVTAASFATTAKVNANNGSTWVSAASHFDASSAPSNHQNLDHVDLGFYYDSCGNGTREGTEQCDQGAANGTTGSCCSIDCQILNSSNVCRVGAGGPCDFDEYCTGTDATCPVDDVYAHNGVVTCRFGAGLPCDPDEKCDGTPGVSCPADVFADTTVICRAGSGHANGGSECDPAEFCPGVGGVGCPPDSFEPSSTPCRPGSGDVCDPQEFCPGNAGGICPVDTVSPNTTQCRAGSGDPNGSGVQCDPPDNCTGNPGEACPSNVPLPATTVCRHGSGDICDPDEKCPGTPNDPCPPNHVTDPSTVCRTGSGDICDPDETCTGTAGAPCPTTDVVQPAGTICRPASDPVCDIAEQCTGTPGQQCPSDSFTSSGTSCDADASICTIDECNGNGACAQSSTLSCDDGNACTQDSCDPVDGCRNTSAPSQTCVPASAASFAFKNASSDDRDALTFKWKGGPVLIASLGNPTQSTQYDFCVYDNSGVKLQVTVPPGANWIPNGTASAPTGYAYKDKNATTAGVKSISLKASSIDKAQIKLLGKGVILPDTTLPLLYPITAQMYASDGLCWDAQFSQEDTRKNDELTFKAKHRGLPPTRTPTITVTSTVTPTDSPTETPVPTITPGGPTLTETPTRTPTVAPTLTVTLTPTITKTETPTPSPTLTVEPGTQIVLLPGGAGAAFSTTGVCRGVCKGGTNAGASCFSNNDCPGSTCGTVKRCAGGPYEGLPCALSADDCNGCNPNNICTGNGAPLACCTGSNAGTCPPAGSCVFLKSNVLSLNLPIDGVCVPRVAPDVVCTSDIECPSGKTCRLATLRLFADPPAANGEATLTIPQSSVVFNPAVTSVATVCLAAAGDGTGTIDCDSGKTGIDVTSRQDHNTTPGSAGNSGSGSGLPDDPSCTATFTHPDGSESTACLEGATGCGNAHPGVCNSPAQFTLSGNYASGDMTVSLPVMITQLASSEKGPDGLACTADDTPSSPGAITTVRLSSGVTSITVYDADNNAGGLLTASVTGAPVSCAGLTGGSATGLKIGGGFSGLDVPVLNDVATALQLVAK